MCKNTRFFQAGIVVMAMGLQACAGTQPVPYSGISSSPRLQPNAQNDAGHMPYFYSARPAWREYSRVIIEPVVIYHGADNQFGDVTTEQQQELAAYMQKQFSQTLAERYQIVHQVSAGTLRIRLTLTGAETTTPVLGTFTRFDLAGGPYNVVQSIRGKQGSFTGSVSYAVEIFDASSQQLLEAYVSKQYPNALNIGASWGALNAAETGIDKGAEQLAERINPAH